MADGLLFPAVGSPHRAGGFFLILRLGFPAAGRCCRLAGLGKQPRLLADPGGGLPPGRLHRIKGAGFPAALSRGAGNPGGLCVLGRGRSRGHHRFLARELFRLGVLLGLHQGVQCILQQNPVRPALAAVDGVLLFGMEGAAGAVPPAVQHLGCIAHPLAAHPLFQSGCQVLGQGPGGRQANPLDIVQPDHALAVVDVFQHHIHADDGLLGDEHGVVHAEQLPGLDVQVTVGKLVLAEDLAAGGLAFEANFQGGQIHPGNIFEGQADRPVPADAALQQLDADKLHRAARGIIVGSGLGNRVKTFLHNTHSFPVCCYAWGWSGFWSSDAGSSAGAAGSS